jgi:hypothetical protein
VRIKTPLRHETCVGRFSPPHQLVFYFSLGVKIMVGSGKLFF